MEIPKDATLLTPGAKVCTFCQQYFVILGLDPEFSAWRVAYAQEFDGQWYRVGPELTPFSTRLMEKIERDVPFLVIKE